MVGGVPYPHYESKPSKREKKLPQVKMVSGVCVPVIRAKRAAL